MKTIKLDENEEYVINEETEIRADKALCISEINSILDTCVRSVDNAIIEISSKAFFLTGIIILNLLSVAAIIFSIVNRSNDLVYIAFAGIAGFLFAPLIILAYKWERKRKFQIINSGEVYPAETLDMRHWQEYREGGDGGGVYIDIYEIDYFLFTLDEDISGTVRFTSDMGFTGRQKKALFDYYKTKKYMFLLYGSKMFSNKKKKYYPVRLYKKDL